MALGWEGVGGGGSEMERLGGDVVVEVGVWGEWGRRDSCWSMWREENAASGQLPDSGRHTRLLLFY